LHRQVFDARSRNRRPRRRSLTCRECAQKAQQREADELSFSPHGVSLGELARSLTQKWLCRTGKIAQCAKSFPLRSIEAFPPPFSGSIVAMAAMRARFKMRKVNMLALVLAAALGAAMAPAGTIFAQQNSKPGAASGSDAQWRQSVLDWRRAREHEL